MGEHESLQVPDLFVREDHPELALDELGHLLAEEVGVQGGRDVASSLDALVLLV